MAEVRLQIPDELIARFQSKMGDIKATEIAKDAITLLNWAFEEKAKGHVILSSDERDKMYRLVMTNLEKVKKDAE